MTLAPEIELCKPNYSESPLLGIYPTEMHMHIHQITYRNVPSGTTGKRAKLKSTKTENDG